MINMQNLKVLKNLEFWYFSFLCLIVLLPVIAPVLSFLGLHNPAKAIYFVFSFMCHQFDSRSLFILDHQYAWCVRDMAIWGGVLAASIGYKTKFLPEIKFAWLIIFLLPIALDGGIQTLNTILLLSPNGTLLSTNAYFSNSLMRFITGILAGIGLGLFIAPKILKKTKVKGKIVSIMFLKRFLFVCFLLLVAYFLQVQLWSLSSTSVKPTNIFDSVPKVQKEYFVRRAYGECKTDATKNFLALDCFLGLK